MSEQQSYNIRITPNIAKMIERNQGVNAEDAKYYARFLQELSNLVICDCWPDLDTPEQKLKFLDTLSAIRLDYECFYESTEEKLPWQK